MDTDSHQDPTRLQLAEAVRMACIQAMRRGYQDAATSGLCAEGALEAAIGAVQQLDLETLVQVE
ncbi:acetyltransferase [Thiohalobacter thiocyanaticus]|uniref:Acetyltransferase n=1 Tax=Thiohalobacter thiocyanaticus TaxID=585455 RepID=A0A426QJC3_9GAMM|nr:acetyltransferase [Thiohalobacter thiocyanaticus]RRQ21845.1 acetyltransferase [Thiohalobacter thiocyanaticus]